MKKFIIMYHASAEAIQKMQSSTPEETQKEMGQWMEWAQRCGTSLTDLGNPLGGGKNLKTDGSAVDSTHGVVGYSILQANDMEQARALLNNHPHLVNGAGLCEIEIHEAMPLPA